MIVVADATPIIALARITQLDLLKSLYSKLTIPEAVYDEIVHAGGERAGVNDVKNAEWISAEAVQDTIAVQLLQERLDKGESEAIVLAIQLKADLLLIDEAKGRRVAEAQGIAVTGTIGTIVAAKRQDLINSAKSVLDALSADGFRIGPKLYNTALAMANETE